MCANGAICLLISALGGGACCCCCCCEHRCFLKLETSQSEPDFFFFCDFKGSALNNKPSQDVIQPFSLPGWSFSSSHAASATVSSTTLSSHHSVLHSSVVLCHTHTSCSYRLKCLVRMNNAQLTQQCPASPVRGSCQTFVKAQRSVLVLEELPLTIWCQKHQINLDSLPPKLSNRSPCKATDKTRQWQQLTCPQEPFFFFPALPLQTFSSQEEEQQQQQHLFLQKGCLPALTW